MKKILAAFAAFAFILIALIATDPQSTRVHVTHQTPSAQADEHVSQVWCEGYNACVIRNYDQVTPGLLNKMANQLDCGNGGAATVPLTWKRSGDGDEYSVTRIGVVCTNN